MDIELAVDAMELAPHIDHMVLFSGDGDFRSLVEAVQRRGVRVTVVSTVSCRPPMLADELRRQCDQFTDLIELRSKIGRDPTERPAREPREGREQRHTPQFLQRSPTSQRVEVEDDEFEDDSRPVTVMARTSGPPGHDCPRCPRLVAFRKSWRKQEPDWFNAPVNSFGPSDARLLIVGLAPGLRGANRTGRPFTGDYAGDLLYSTLLQFGFAQGQYQARPDDGLRLIDCRITNAVRCVPSENKRTPRKLPPAGRSSPRPSPTCRAFRPYLRSAASRTTPLSWHKARAGRRIRSLTAACQFGAFKFYNSYHCSRLNTNTGVLTPKMFCDLIGRIRAELDVQTPALT